MHEPWSDTLVDRLGQEAFMPSRLQLPNMCGLLTVKREEWSRTELLRRKHGSAFLNPPPTICESHLSYGQVIADMPGNTSPGFAGKSGNTS